MNGKVEIFIIFDKEDVNSLRELKNHLRSLEMQDIITVWDSSQIVAGTDWKQTINSHLETASVFLLLLSANFIASQDVYNLALRAMAKRASAKVIVPVLLQFVDWEDSAFGKLAPLPYNGRFISDWSNRNAAYVDVVKGIRRIVMELQVVSGSEQPDTAMASVHSPSDQEIVREKSVVAQEKVILTSDPLEYNIEDQPWYLPIFPQTAEIDQMQIDALKKEIDVVIFTATDIELKAVIRFLEVYPRRKSVLRAFIGPETYYIGKFGAYRTVVTRCRMGSVSEGSVILATQQAQHVWHPKAIIMVGIAFGKDPAKQKIADVLVASQIIPYEQMRVGAQEIFRGAIPPSNIVLLNRFENTTTWRFVRPDGKDCSLLVGPLLSGEKLVDNPEFKQQLFHQFPQAIGGEMEGAGLCAASGRVGVAWILVKSICDWADGKKHGQHQPLAAAAAVSLVHHVLSQKTALNSIEKH